MKRLDFYHNAQGAAPATLLPADLREHRKKQLAMTEETDHREVAFDDDPRERRKMELRAQRYIGAMCALIIAGYTYGMVWGGGSLFVARELDGYIGSTAASIVAMFATFGVPALMWHRLIHDPDRFNVRRKRIERALAAAKKIAK